MRGGGINATTSHRTRDYHGGGKSNGNGDGDGADETTATLIVDDADGGNSGVAIVGSASLAAGDGVIN